MLIPAIDLVGQYQIRLENVENVFTRLANKAAGGEAASDDLKNISASLEEVINLRVQFEQVRAKYVNEIKRALAGEPCDIQLNDYETRVIDTVSEMYKNVQAVHARLHGRLEA